jgi:hypothetical protein
MRPEAAAGAIGVVYGDFFPRGWGLGHTIRQNSLFRDIIPYLFFQFLILFLLFQVCIRITEVRGRFPLELGHWR